MKRHRHTPEQAIRKRREGERLLAATRARERLWISWAGRPSPLLPVS